MKLQKPFRYILVLALALMLFGQAIPASAITITYAGWGSPDEIRSIEAEIEAFHKKYPDSGIRIENLFGPWDGYHEKLIVQAAAGTLPDLMLISGSFFQNIEANDVFLDLRPFFERAGLQTEYLPKGTEGFLTMNQKLAALPAAGFIPGGPMVNVNLDMYAQVGLAPPSWDWTWDDLLVYAQRVTRDVDGDGIADYYGVNFGKTTGEAAWEYMIRAYGGSLWNEDYTASAINSPAGEWAFQYLKDLDDRWGVHGGNFMDGTSAMTIEWANTALQIKRNSDFAHIDIAPLPKGTHGRGMGPADGRVHVFAVNKQTGHPEAVWQFLHFLFAEPEASLARLSSSVASPGYLPVAQRWMEERPEDERAWLEIGLLYESETPPGPKESSPLLISYDDQQAIITFWLDQFYAGDIPVTSALLGMQQQLDAKLAEVRQQAGL